MKIDEFKAKLKPLAYTATDTRSGIISVYTHNYWGEDDANGWCFQLDPALKTVIVKKQWDKLDGMPVFCLRDLLNLITELEKTPVKERFLEKKYRLVANPNSLEQTGTYAAKYVACIQDGMDCFSFVYGGPTVFLEKELKQIEELHPNIAPAIDAMKEEVKDNEAD